MDKIIILDFGSQYTQLIARRIRELKVYSEIVPYNITISELKKSNPKALILSGGPRSVYEENAPLCSKEIFNLNIPILGICYGLQLIAHLLGGKVKPAEKREYGFAKLNIIDNKELLSGIRNETQIWMSHGDVVVSYPRGFIVSASTLNTPIAVIENRERKIYGVQFHPEVKHTIEGKKILSNFLFKISNLKAEWNLTSFLENIIEKIKNEVNNGKVICGLSGGVDSTVTALILRKAIGDNVYSIFIDNGLLRENEFQYLMRKFREKLHLKVIGVNASHIFLKNLKGVKSPERKRKIIGNLFIKIFKEEAKKIGNVEFFAQGTTYPDVIESRSVKGPSSVIKSHHNVGGLPPDLDWKLIEPLKELFKDEVREIGRKLGLDEEFINRHPFPGPGLAVRIIGEVTRKRVKILQRVDKILTEEIKKAGIYNKLWQAFPILLPIKSVGVMGDERTYKYVIALRVVESIDGMTASWYPMPHNLMQEISSRIVNEVKEVNRVVYDITNKPPATIEWE
ncbi:glutamine-hydrolyzing GMP synthase [SCandidatus Aminicenantes bacterium Aminicenantia_JdfR_composite]|jgi:GMP synthase (glutamine-hydrolysing)|nr:glutamine-hydrolyzing GMP synthase [SCandidatus Aminicenantes bacterium Aminicenantia_JdfR_composite]MCP2597751.1 glutamine-hydrolyzing GMP synthase [Candidatus Aminicenantes bacterium AC-335-L06]